MAINSIRTVIRNFASLMSSEVVNRATTFVLYALIARYLGTFAFGQLSLAITLFAVFQVLAGAGLKTLITREVAKDKTKTGQYLVNGSAIVVACSLVSVLLVLPLVRFMSYAHETAIVILLLSFGVLPFSLSALNKAVFQAWECMHYIAWANIPVHVAKVVLAYLLLRNGQNVFALILLLLATYVAILVIEWWLLLRHVARPRLSIDTHFCVAMMRSTGPFLGITFIVAINVNLDLIMLSRFTNEVQVGLYGAAAQLITPVIVIYDTIMMSVFPEMCRRFTTGLARLRSLSEHILELLLVIALPIVIGLLFLAEPTFLLLYGNADFVLASQALRVLSWTLILTAYTHVLGRALFAGLREKVALRIVVITTLVKLAIGLLLISRFGLIGAAVTALLISLVEALLHYASVSRLLFQLPLGRLAWKPITAGACMAMTLALLRGQGFLLTVLSAGTVYTLILLALMIRTNGGLRQFATKYQYLLSK